MNLTTFAFIISGVLLNAVAQVLLKAGTNALGGAIHLTMSNALETFIRVATQLPILAGLACYALSLVVWIMGLSRTDVSIAYPMLSLGYVVAAVGAWVFLGETIPPQRLLGIAVILVGVVVLARS
ncbi:EamA family transporter [Massilia aerilata]|uniref:EamA family transporter n=1 Tax=Massilia aerilata TaxID=453817 RepID=A0ABW0RU74_9BURK